MQVLAVDPGTHKCGVAIVANETPPRTLYRAVVATRDLPQAVRGLLQENTIDAVLIGDATHTREAQAALRPLLAAETPFHLVPEAFTSERARMRWRTENPPRNLWERLLPGFRVPDCCVDDYAAVILAEQFLSSLR